MSYFYVVSLSDMEAKVLKTLYALQGQDGKNAWTPAEVWYVLKVDKHTVHEIADVLYTLWENRIITRIAPAKGDSNWVSLQRYTPNKTDRKVEIRVLGDSNDK